MNVDLVFGRLGLSSPEHRPAVLKAKELLRRSTSMTTSYKGTTCKAIAVPAACCLLALEHLEVAVPGAKDARSLAGKVQVLSGTTAKGFKDTVSTLRTALNLRRGAARSTSTTGRRSSSSSLFGEGRTAGAGAGAASSSRLSLSFSLPPSSSGGSGGNVSVHRMCLQFGCPELEGKVVRLLEEYRREFLKGLHESRRGSADFSSPVFAVAAFFLVAKKNKQSSSVSGGRRGLQEAYDLSAAEFSRVIQSMEDHCPSIRTKTTKAKPTSTAQSEDRKRKRKRKGSEWHLEEEGDDLSQEEDELDAREAYQLQVQYEEWKRAACENGKRDRDLALREKATHSHSRGFKQTRLDFFTTSTSTDPKKQLLETQDEGLVPRHPPVF